MRLPFLHLNLLGVKIITPSSSAIPYIKQPHIKVDKEKATTDFMQF